MTAQLLARQLFAPPGDDAHRTRHLLAQAAAAHAHLLDSAAKSDANRVDAERLYGPLSAYLRSAAPSAEKRDLLDEPQFVEALHALAGASDMLAGWDAAVAPGCALDCGEQQMALGRGLLGGVVAAVRLRHRRNWCGQVELAADEYGRVHFPFCDWAVVLVEQRAGRRELLDRQALVLDLGPQLVRWRLPGQELLPLVSMPRELFNAMFVDNRQTVDAGAMQFAPGSPSARFERATRLRNTRIRFEPISDYAPAAHAELTGGIVAALVAAIARNAPSIYQQFCQSIRTIRGFELPRHLTGQIASFSLPTCPGVIGFNVEYTALNEPQFSPYAFMWLGHELGHTLHYLIDDVAYTHGWQFLENPGERTPPIPRYGRGLSVRTLFQVPYVHLFEWWLLALFYHRGFAGLPWRMFGDAIAVGNDVRNEIKDSFELIEQHARLTATGQAVLARLRELVTEVESFWRQSVAAAGRVYRRAQ